MTDEKTARLDLHLFGTHLGWLTSRSSDKVEFRASESAIGRFGLNSRVLSVGLPLTPVAQDATAFVGGLLPEGPALANLRRQLGPSDQSLFGLIRFVGRDVAGAVTFGELQSEGDHVYIPLSDEDVAERLDAAATLPLGRMTGGTSLTGYQRKITLARRDGQWFDREGGAVSTHILKPVEPARETAIQAEGYALALGRSVGLLAYHSFVTHFAGRPTLVIERYDRLSGADGRTSRVHQEDAAQALGLDWTSEYLKFEHPGGPTSHRSIAALLPKRRTVFDDATPELDQLLRYVTFTVAIGNTDAHAKNYSLMHSAEGRTTLAPLYDVAPHALGYDSQQALAIGVNGTSRYAEVTVDDLVSEARGWGVPAERARRTVVETLLGVESAVLSVPAHESIQQIVPGYVLGQTYNLLAGRPGLLDLPHPLGLLQQIRLPARPVGLPERLGQRGGGQARSSKGARPEAAPFTCTSIACGPGW